MNGFQSSTAKNGKSGIRLVFTGQWFIMSLIEPPKAMRANVSSNRGVAFFLGLKDE